MIAKVVKTPLIEFRQDHHGRASFDVHRCVVCGINHEAPMTKLPDGRWVHRWPCRERLL